MGALLLPLTQITPTCWIQEPSGEIMRPLWPQGFSQVTQSWATSTRGEFHSQRHSPGPLHRWPLEGPLRVAPCEAEMPVGFSVLEVSHRQGPGV